VQLLVAAVQGDLEGIASLVREALARTRSLERDGGLVPGLASVLKAKGAELERMLEVLEGEKVAVPKKLTGSTEPVAQYVDAAKVAELRASSDA